MFVGGRHLSDSGVLSAGGMGGERRDVWFGYENDIGMHGSL